MKYDILKKCKYCEAEFKTKPRFIEYCSQKCKNPLNRGEYGAWNKGKKMSKEYIETKMNLKGLEKGRGHNKGKKNPEQAKRWTGENNPNWNGKMNNQRPKNYVDDEFTAYKRECRKATYRSRYAMMKDGTVPANTGKRKNQYQLDHIIPFKQGYDLGIDPKIIGSRNNLQWLLGEDNRKKWDSYQPNNIIKTILGDQIMAYSAKVLDHYENPRNVGSLDKEDMQVGTGMVGAPACG